MTEDEFKNLTRGDIVRHKGLGDSWLIDMSYGNRKTAIRTVDLTNPDEWELISKANYKIRK